MWFVYYKALRTYNADFKGESASFVVQNLLTSPDVSIHEIRSQQLLSWKEKKKTDKILLHFFFSPLQFLFPPKAIWLLYHDLKVVESPELSGGIREPRCPAVRSSLCAAKMEACTLSSSPVERRSFIPSKATRLTTSRWERLQTQCGKFCLQPGMLQRTKRWLRKYQMHRGSAEWIYILYLDTFVCVWEE